MTPVAERFWSKVDRDGPLPADRPDLDPCWIWTASILTSGYGRFKMDRRVVLAHRVAYELEVGPIPPGLTIDHLCRRPLCVRPTHLEPVTSLENTRRGTKASATACPRGHAFDEANTYITPQGRRRCKACVRARQMSRRSLAR